MIDSAEAYVEVKHRLTEVIGDPATRVGTPVPACPGWSVRDVVAHHVGVVVDVTQGNLGDLAVNLLDQWHDREVQRARDAMTAGQLDQRRNRSPPSSGSEAPTD